jgi:hypothetical protein
MRFVCIAALLIVLASSAGCGTDCRAECEQRADELVNVWGIERPCTEPAWDDADDCEACDATLEELYGLTPDRSLCED